MKITTYYDGRVTRTEARSDRRSSTFSHHWDIVGRGTAQCKPDDVYSQFVGKEIAMARAIADFGRQVEEIALASTVSLDEARRVDEIRSR